MKRNYTYLASLIVAIVLTGSAYAGDGMSSMNSMGPGAMAGPGGPMAGKAQRPGSQYLQLRSDLKLTPQQEPLWLAYIDKLKSHGGKKAQAMSAPAADEKLTAPERMAKMQGQMEERLAAMKSIHESFNRFYAALTPEQKAVADQYAARMGQGGGKRGGMQPPPAMTPPPQKPQG